MDEPTIDETPTARVARWFQPTSSELAGLAILVLGAVVASGVLWLQATQRPSGFGSEAASVGAALRSDGTTDGPAPGVEDDHAETGPEDEHAASDPYAGAASDTPGDHAEAEVAEVTVHVTGAVAVPGVVVLPGGGRVADAVAAAGGLIPGAQDERINLARPLVDGEHVHVLREGEEPAVSDAVPPSGPTEGSDAAAAGGAGGVGADGRVDINRASAAELESLPGIGPARSEQIVAHRDAHGPFRVPGDLREVPGIGEVTFQRLAKLVTAG